MNNDWFICLLEEGEPEYQRYNLEQRIKLVAKRALIKTRLFNVS
jgi:hypothetical protein